MVRDRTVFLCSTASSSGTASVPPGLCDIHSWPVGPFEEDIEIPSDRQRRFAKYGKLGANARAAISMWERIIGRSRGPLYPPLRFLNRSRPCANGDSSCESQVFRRCF
jgi:hypothetical protein